MERDVRRPWVGGRGVVLPPARRCAERGSGAAEGGAVRGGAQLEVVAGRVDQVLPRGRPDHRGVVDDDVPGDLAGVGVGRRAARHEGHEKGCGKDREGPSEGGAAHEGTSCFRYGRSVGSYSSRRRRLSGCHEGATISGNPMTSPYRRCAFDIPNGARNFERTVESNGSCVNGSRTHARNTHGQGGDESAPCRTVT